jgi:hypothetical protein
LQCGYNWSSSATRARPCRKRRPDAKRTGDFATNLAALECKGLWLCAKQLQSSRHLLASLLNARNYGPQRLAAKLFGASSCKFCER